ncbi:MAG: hypothetical protein K2I19_09730 [Muribaculaceae bacterium]|nr:hypothetical protein [Muribaculaceae bacterium]
MDEKDLIETLTTIGIFAISVAIGLVSEHRKKRKNAPAAPKPKQRNAAANIATPQQGRKATASAYAQQTVAHSPETTTKPHKTKTYSFTPEEEGGCSLEHDHFAAANTDSSAAQVNDDERRQILRTLIVGEVLATPRFKN